jgi:hypothetical protein
MKYPSFAVLSMLVAGMFLGVTSPAHAYTINTTEVGKRIRWSHDTVSLQMDSEFENFLDAGDAYAAFAIGQEAWRGMPRVPDMVIRPGVPESLGHHDGHETNGIYLLRDWPYEAAKLAVTIVTYEMDTGRLLDADIVVNGQAKFALLSEPAEPGNTNYDLAAVLTHESGHVLGLGESAEGPDATMWPYASPDDTGKRSLAQDDEDGVIESYASAPPAAAGGCGPNTVGGRASGHSGLLSGLWLLAVIPALRLRLSRRQRRFGLLALAFMLVGLSFGFDTQTAQQSFGEARLAKVEQLLRDGSRDDRARLEALTSDADDQVARRAQFALSRVLSRAGAVHVAATSSDGAVRVQNLMGSGKQIMLGHAKRSGTVQVNGLFFTEYSVQTQSGTTTTLRVAGGAKDGIAQRVIDAEPPPADDQDVAVVPQADGSQHWAYHQAGLLFGGHLGDGAAVEGAI